MRRYSKLEVLSMRLCYMFVFRELMLGTEVEKKKIKSLNS